MIKCPYCGSRCILKREKRYMPSPKEKAWGKPVPLEYGCRKCGKSF